VNASGFDVHTTTIRENIALAEAPATGTDIFRYKPRSNGARDYEALAAEYLKANKDIRHTKHGYK
jgi:chromosome partitioning protein